jgi:cell division protein FtsX
VTYPEPTAETDAAPAPDEWPRRRRTILWILASAVALILVSGAAFGAGYLVGRPAKEQYTISVFMKKDATQADKDGVRAALEALDPVDGVRFETKEEAVANAQRTFRDNPEALEYMTAENLPESFRATITRRDLTCAEIRPIPKLSGVDTFLVGRPMPKSGDRPAMKVEC